MSTLRVGTISNTGGTASTSADNVINGSAKAWVNFNGTGTVAIRAGYNVSSITDLGTGRYIVNMTNALADANGATLVACAKNDGTDDGAITAQVGGFNGGSSNGNTTTQSYIVIRQGGAIPDTGAVFWAAFR